MRIGLMVVVVLCSCGGDDASGPKGRFAVETVASGLSDVVDAALSPDGSIVYYLTRGAGGGLFEVTDAGTRKLEDFEAGHALGISRDGRTLFVVDDEDGVITLRPDGSLGRTVVPGTGDVLAPRLWVGDEMCMGNGPQVDCIPLAGGPTSTLVEDFPSDVRGVAITVGDRFFATTAGGIWEAAAGRGPEKLSDVVGNGSIVLSLDETELLVATETDGGAQVTIVARDGATVEVFDDVIGGGAARCLARAPDDDVFVFCSDDRVYLLTLR